MLVAAEAGTADGRGAIVRNAVTIEVLGCGVVTFAAPESPCGDEAALVRPWCVDFEVDDADASAEVRPLTSAS